MNPVEKIIEKVHGVGGVVFVEDGCEIPEVPVWAMKLVLTREEVEEMDESTNK